MWLGGQLSAGKGLVLRGDGWSSSCMPTSPCLAFAASLAPGAKQAHERLVGSGQPGAFPLPASPCPIHCGLASWLNTADLSGGMLSLQLLWI